MCARACLFLARLRGLRVLRELCKRHSHVHARDLAPAPMHIVHVVCVHVSTNTGTSSKWSSAQSAPYERRLHWVTTLACSQVDVIIEVDRLPVRDETISSRTPDTGKTVTGGKGANQAVAAARLGADPARKNMLVCHFGTDAHAPMLEQASQLSSF